ncbi:MAG: hypothetical protein P8R42_12880 [Candidatus Binatia bacterium]|nr:hypothetical protein [Candidatus Binatia bacterium]
MEFEDSDLTALDFTKESRLRLKMLLGDGDGTELATFGTEVALQEPLPVARGARADRATFKYEGRNSALARATVVRRGGRLKVSLKVGKATLGVPAACQAGAGHTFLTTAVSLESGVTGVSDLGLSTTQLWRCLPSGDGSFNLRVENKGSRSGGGGSGGGNRRPQAKIDVENSTRTPDTPNWFELSAERSSDRDGEIRSYAFAVERRRENADRVGPPASSSPTARVRLSPGGYEITLTVTDDQGAQDSTSHRVSVRGASPPGDPNTEILWDSD